MSTADKVHEEKLEKEVTRSRSRTSSITNNPKWYQEAFRIRNSLLSSDAAPASFRGALNLTIILLFITNFNLVISNFWKYGFLVTQRLSSGVGIEWYRWPALITLLALNIFIFCAHALEISAAKRTMKENRVIQLHILNILAVVVVPSTMLWILKPNPAGGIIVMIWTSILCMKLVSYAHVNYTMRHEAKTDVADKDIVQYPNNLTLKDIYFFMGVPTLCYSPHYPRTNRIRIGFLIRRISEAIFFSFLIYAIVEQYVVPVVHNSMGFFKTNDLVGIVERTLRLSVPNIYVWLLGFYVFFHLYLNICAEIFRFGDRLFYKAWWNSSCLSEFWRYWNMPVHQWMSQHIYMPARNAGFSRRSAIFFCFLVSAIFHELVIGVPFQMIKLWSFAGILVQIPGIFLSEPLKGTNVGNVLFWLSIVVGQPFLVLMVYRDWYVSNGYHLMEAPSVSNTLPLYAEFL
eukprot:TRINITY_DN2149_c0_g1_i1.p1 TRINITY_DN2149_c0_g1~~TRINITY_DN2149_c0_g1_i1.p1  ORF type:complete len:459 (+),score=37.97 TRINITY_DN2149_c0_g1_i1:134-1510(+)